MNDFYKKLKLGNKKEKMVCDILNLCGINCELNNLGNVKNIDLKSDDLKMIIDVKYIHTPFFNSESYFGINSANCLPIKIRHVNNYYNEEIQSNSQAWVCFLVDFDEYNIHEIRFIPVSQLKHIVNCGKGRIRNGNLNIDKDICYNMQKFLNFCEKRKIHINNPIKYSFK